MTTYKEKVEEILEKMIDSEWNHDSLNILKEALTRIQQIPEDDGWIKKSEVYGIAVDIL